MESTVFANLPKAKLRLHVLPTDITEVQKVALFASMLNEQSLEELITRLQFNEDESKRTIEGCTVAEIEAELKKTYGRKPMLFTRRRECFNLQQPAHQELSIMVYAQGLSDSRLKHTLLTKLVARKEDEQTSLSKIHELALHEVQCHTHQQVAAITKYKPRYQPTPHFLGHHPRKNDYNSQPKKAPSRQTPPNPCWGCGQMHYNDQCPFKDKKCLDCASVGHKQGYCNRKQRKQVNAVKKIDIPTSKKTVAHIKRHAMVTINGVPVEVLVDSGADINIINEDTWYDLDQPKLQIADAVLNASNQPMSFYGYFTGTLEWNGQQVTERFYVTANSPQLIGYGAIQATGIDKIPLSKVCVVTKNPILAEEQDAEALKQSLQQEFPTVFDIYLKRGVQPVFRKARQLPYSKQQKYSDYAAPIVVVQKPSGAIRLCNDYSTGLNDQLQMNRHPMSTIEDMLSSFNGIPAATGIFQEIMDKMIAGIPGSLAYLDDIIITGRIKDYGFHLRLEKCRFFLKEVNYVGMIAPIYEMSSPKNDVKWNWSEECEDAFKKLKEALASPLLIAHFNPDAEHIVTADASEYGIGCTLLQRTPNGLVHAVAHASKSLTLTQRKYAQIEKEAFALTYAVKKFHKYIPLLTIFGSKKGVPTLTASRLQRYALILLNYDFTLEHIATDKFGHADVLSRLISDQREADYEAQLKVFCISDDDHDVNNSDTETDSPYEDVDSTSSLPVRLEEVRKASMRDGDMRQLYKLVKLGWPPNTRNLSPTLRKYAVNKHAFSIIKETVCYCDRIVVPNSLRNRANARRLVYWCGINKEIEDLYNSCSKCMFLILVDFAYYCLKNSIRHITCAPYHPQSNEQAERFVDTFKRSMSKQASLGKDTVDQFLFNYRTSPHDNSADSLSPDELMMGCRLRSPLQAPEEPKIPAIILRSLGNVMYMVESDGKRFRRHINQMRPRRISSSPDNDDDSVENYPSFSLDPSLSDATSHPNVCETPLPKANVTRNEVTPTAPYTEGQMSVSDPPPDAPITEDLQGYRTRTGRLSKPPTYLEFVHY
uniref:Peptidase A2 domain-containing protein n=1 Tax=Heterorhabditis bacteriophora TaxID=37862 RepID=A0A1I7WTP2_HETBA